MLDFDVVAAVSKTLETFLTSALSTVTPPPAPQAVVHDLQSAPSTTPPKLTLYLATGRQPETPSIDESVRICPTR